MKNYYLIVSLFLFVVFVSSCGKDEQSKLVGYWEQVSFYNPDSTPTKVFWRFTSGDVVTIYKITGEINDSIEYTYNISGGIFDVFSSDFNDIEYLPAARDPRGQYWVDYLKNDQFKATKLKHPDGTTGGVYMRVELVKR